MMSGRTLRFIILALAVVCCLAGAYLLRNAGIDDVGISYRYAKHMAEGHGLTWNVGEPPVEGYSNLLWVLILSLSHFLGADIEDASRVLGLLFGLLTLWLTYRLSAKIVNDPASPFPAVAALLVALTPAWLMWMMSGLEIALYGFLLVSAVLALTMQGTRRVVVMALSLAGIVLSRPEGIALAMVYLASVWALRRKTREAGRSDLIVGAISVLATVAAVTTFRLLYYGYPLPNTVYAKFSTLFPSAWQVGLWLFYTLPFLILAGIAMRGTWRKPEGLPLVVAIAMTVAQTAIVLPVNPVMHFLHRYTIAFVPLLFLAVPIALTRLSGRAMRWGWPAILMLCAWLLQDWPGVNRFHDANAFNVRRQLCVADVLKSIPGQPRIAMGDSGRIPYWTDLPAIDLWGLCDRRIGHEGFSAKYILEYPAGPPDVIIMALRPEAGDHVSVFGGDELLMAEQGFKDGYKLWGLCAAELGERPKSTNPHWFLDYALYLRNGLEMPR